MSPALLDALYRASLEQLADHQTAMQTLPTHCYWCNAPLPDHIHSPYCSMQCGIDAEVNG